MDEHHARRRLLVDLAPIPQVGQRNDDEIDAIDGCAAIHRVAHNGGIIEKLTRHLDVAGIRVNHRQRHVGQHTTKHEGRAWEETAANDNSGANLAEPRQQASKRPLVGTKHEPLQERREHLAPDLMVVGNPVGIGGAAYPALAAAALVIAARAAGLVLDGVVVARRRAVVEDRVRGAGAGGLSQR